MLSFSAKEVPGLGAEVGTCGFNGPFETEDDRINLNCANVPASFPVIKSALDALLFFQAYDPVFEEADAEGWRRIDKAEIVTALPS